jgi:hypothetical protein
MSDRRAYHAAYRRKNRKRLQAQEAVYRRKNRKRLRAQQAIYYQKVGRFRYRQNRRTIQMRAAARAMAQKIMVLTRYSKNRQLCCAWNGCQITDVDMLTLDHVKNDGAKHRAQIGRGHTYQWVIRHNFPKGFQTLCGSHQLKKEVLRRRSRRNR